jgi:Na+/melibiose symporter-like transporter
LLWNYSLTEETLAEIQEEIDASKAVTT